MTLLSATNYLQLLDKAWYSQDAALMANLLSLRDDHTQSVQLFIDQPRQIVEYFVTQPLDELVMVHLKCLYVLSQQKYFEAYKLQIIIVHVVTKIIQSQKDENWLLPVMYVVCSDLRLLAQQANRESIGMGRPGQILERAAECLMNCFRVCAADNRSSEEDTKRIGMLNLVNQLFKVYFSINKLHLCKPLIRAIDCSPFKEMFPLGERITYRYYVGRKAMFDSDYKSADAYLTYAFENCLKSSTHNKRLILISLVPIKMLLGYIPNKHILEKYDLLAFWDVVQAVCQGNLKRFDELMMMHELFFINCGIYLIMDKLKILVYRNLFKKLHLILNTYQIPLESLKDILEFLGQGSVSLDETECIVANLIFEGKIKGYISHQHRKVVVSKKNPFPLLTLLS